MAQEYQLFLRGTVWYYKLRGEKTFHSTRVRGKRARAKAESWVRDNKLTRRSSDSAVVTFRDYADPYFVWDRCPRIARLRADGKSIGRLHAKNQRSYLKRFVFDDPFAEIPLRDIRRGDVLDFRSRLSNSLGDASLQRCLNAVKAILSEAWFREDIPHNPGSRVTFKYQPKERGTLKVDELREMFSVPPGIWKDAYGFGFFNTAARTGMRVSEVAALRWRDVDLEDSVLSVRHAWKSNTELGPPKNGKSRILPVGPGVLEPLLHLHEDGIRVTNDDLVFCYEATGNRFGQTWWKKRFSAALGDARIKVADRNITPHSLRHSLNSHLVRTGAVPEALIREYFGWSQGAGALTSVQASYTHIRTSDLRVVAERVQELFE